MYMGMMKKFLINVCGGNEEDFNKCTLSQISTVLEPAFSLLRRNYCEHSLPNDKVWVDSRIEVVRN